MNLGIALEYSVETNLAISLCALGISLGRILVAKNRSFEESVTYSNVRAQGKPYHLLERETLRLGNKEPDEACAEGSHQPKEDVGSVSNMGEQVGRGLADDEVVPVVVSCTFLSDHFQNTYIQLLDAPRDTIRGVLRGHTSAMIIQAQGPQDSAKIRQFPIDVTGFLLTSKVGYKQPDHTDGSPTCGSLFIETVDVLGQNDSDDEVACSHPNCTDDQNRFSSGTVDPEDSLKCCNKHDDADDTCRDETGRG